MKLPEMISDYRLRKNDYVTPDLEIIGQLERADKLVFDAEGGVKNAEIAQALLRTWEDTIEPKLKDVVLPHNLLGDVKVFVEDGWGRIQLCKSISPADALRIDLAAAFKPAASIDVNKVTVYPSGAFRTGYRNVTIVYVKPPSNMLMLGGYWGAIDTGKSYGVKAKPNYPAISFTFPEDRPEFQKNELQGAFVTLQVSETYQRIYKIEQHAAGMLTTVYVNPTYEKMEAVDIGFTSQDVIKGYRATIHRGSELPESFHQKIVELAVT